MFHGNLANVCSTLTLINNKCQIQTWLLLSLLGKLAINLNRGPDFFFMNIAHLGNDKYCI